MEEDISDGYELDEEFDGDLESSAFSDSQSIDSRSCGEPVSEKDTQVHLEEEMVSDLGLMPVPVDENPFLKPRTSSDVSPRILKRGEILSDGGNNANVTFSLNQAEKWPNLASVVKDTCLNGNSMNVDEIMGMNQYGNNKLKLIPGRINDKGRHVADMDPLLEEGSKAWVSSCSTSKVQEKTQLSRSRCMNSLREVKSQFKFLSESLQDFSTMSIFKRTFSQDLDLLEQHLTKEITSQADCKTILTKLRTTFENAFNSEFKERMQKYTRFDAQSLQDAMICNMDSIGKYMLEITVHQQRTPQLLKQKKLMQTQDHSNPIQALNVNSLKVDLVVIQNTCSEKEDSNSETASSKSVKESSLNSETKDVHAIKYKMSKAKERCMAYFRSLHSHLQVLSKEDLKGTRIEHGFKRAFMSLFGQDVDTFTSTMLLNVDQLQKQLDKDEFQEDGSMAAFWVTSTLLNTLESRLNTSEIHYSNTWVMSRSPLLKEHVIKDKSIRTDSIVQDESSRSGNDTDADDADIRPIYDEELMTEYPETQQLSELRSSSSRKRSMNVAHVIVCDIKLPTPPHYST
ncbi:hypothetical protein Tco_0509194 [Tanacetum coccineum]